MAVENDWADDTDAVVDRTLVALVIDTDDDEADPTNEEEIAELCS